MVLKRQYGSLCVVIGPYASLWLLMGSYASLHVLKVSNVSLWVLMRPYRSLCDLMDSKGPDGFLCVSMSPVGS